MSKRSKDTKDKKTNVMRLLDQADITYTSHNYESTGAISGVEVAAVLGQDPDRTFKTLVTHGRQEHYVFIVPVAAELDLKKAASAVGEKSIEMIKQKELLPLTGYVHGGCSPIGMKKFFTIILALLALQAVKAQGTVNVEITDANWATYWLTDGVDFTSNSDIQAYSLSKQNMNPLVLTFTDVQTVPAHTPFAFKRLNSNPQSTEFLMKDNSGNFGIIVNATRSTNAAEKTWTVAGGAPEATPGSPYTGSTGLSNWKTKGYYVKETKTDYDGMYFIQDNYFKRAVGPLNLVDHRALFYPTGAAGAASVFALSFVEEDMATAIEEAETEQTLSEATEIYDASGCRLSEARKGLNIIRMSDGTIKKVFIK